MITKNKIPENMKHDNMMELYAKLVESGSSLFQTIAVNAKTLPEMVLEAMYRADRLVRKIVELIVFYMLKEGFEVPDDTEGQILKVFNSTELNAHGAIEDFLITNRKMGGSLLLMGLDDGGTYRDELNLNTLKKITHFQVYSRYEIFIHDNDVDSNPESSRYNMPKLFEITPVNGSSFKVHYSRVAFLQGEPVSNNTRVNVHDNFWGDSILQGLVDYIDNFHGGITAES